jgi:hypothetical protein
MHDRRGGYPPGGPSLWLEPRAPPCSKCGATVTLTQIEPHSPGFDLRSFECPKCYQVDRYSVEYGTSEPWALLAPTEQHVTVRVESEASFESVSTHTPISGA